MTPEENEARSKALYKHPRVSLDDIKDNIAGEWFFTAGDAARMIGAPNHEALDLLTICVLLLGNGFTVLGKSAPASPLNFDPEYGKILAREDAIKQIWPLMAFALRDRLSGGYLTISEKD